MCRVSNQLAEASRLLVCKELGVQRGVYESTHSRRCFEPGGNPHNELAQGGFEQCYGRYDPRSMLTNPR